MRVIRCVVTVAVLLVADAVVAGTVLPLDGPHRPFDDELLDRRVGSWHLSGAIQGEAAG